MKRSRFIVAIEILLLIVVLAGAYLLARPVGLILERSLESAIRDGLSSVREATGLSLSYSSMSPSVFRSIHLSNLEIRDATGDSLLASFPDVEIVYSLSEVISGNGATALKKIAVRGGMLRFDPLKDAAIAERITRLLSSDSAGNAFVPDRLRIELSSLSLELVSAGRSVAALVKSGTATFNQDGLAFLLDASVTYADESGKRGLMPGRATAAVKFDGQFDPSFTSGSSSVAIRNLKSDTFSTDSVRFLATLRDRALVLDSTQDLQPVDFNVVYDPDNGAISGSFACDRLFPLRWIRPPAANRVLQSLESLQASGSGAFTLDREKFTWQLDLDSRVPSAFIGGGSLSVKGSGRDSSAEVTQLAFTGPRGDAEGAFIFDFSSWSADGYLSVANALVGRGTPVSADLYMQPGKSGTTFLIPELAIGSSSYSGLEITASRTETSLELGCSGFDSNGQFSLDGTLSRDDRWYLQLFGAFDSVSVANVLRTITSLISPGTIDETPGIDSGFAEYQATTEAYFSTDFSHLSFNCPRLVLASTEQNGLFLLVSANGTEKNLELTDIALSSGGYTLSGGVGAEFEKNSLLFTSEMLLNSLPYRFNGMLSGQTLSVYGDYGLALSLFLSRQGGISGGVSVANLPVPVGEALISTSLEATVFFSSMEDWRIGLEKGHLEEVSGLLPLSSTLDFTGSVDPNGVFLDNCSISDSYSRIAGYMGLNWFVPGTGPLRYEAQAMLTSETGDESILLEGSVVSGLEPFFTLSGSVKNTPLSRFLDSQGPTNLGSGSFTLSGTLDTPFATADLEGISVRVGGFDLALKGTALLDDRSCTLSSASASWNGNILGGMNVVVDLADLSATMTASYRGVLGNSGIDAKVRLEFATESGSGSSTLERARAVFDSCTVEATVSEVTWKDIKSESSLTLELSRRPGMTEIIAGLDGALSGYLADSGDFSFSSRPGNPVSFDAAGTLRQGSLDMKVNDILIDAASFWRLTGVDAVSVQGGTIAGSIGVSGLLNDPEFSGELAASGIVLGIPALIEQNFLPFGFTLLANKKDFSIPEFRLRSKKGSTDISAIFLLERWVPNSFTVKSRVPLGEEIKIDAKTPYLAASGYAGWDLVADLTGGKLSLTGTTSYERGSIAVLSAPTGSVSSSGANRFIENFVLDLAVSLGNKVEFRWPTDELPIISGLLQADEPLKISLDTAAHRFSFRGVTNLKGGQLFYVKRNFYLRQGRIEFNENENIFDPVITLRAEIRERDEGGDPVRIILSAENQPLSRFSPVLSADPAKSELEILSLLGQAAIADTSRETIVRDTVITASDLFTQLSLFRQAENGIRDLLGLDLFSIRTLIIQNAIFGPAMRTDSETPMTIGNYFDNTTVYMGKYLGSAMYADALLHFSYYDPKSDQNTGTEQSLFENMLVQPEFGLEVTTPFFLLRWGITPGFTPENLRTLFVPDNAVTLSWKFSY